LQERVLEGKEPITCRPADLLEPEMDKLTAELKKLAAEKGIKLATDEVDDVLTYALFPQVGLKFLENRGNPAAFEPVPSANDVAPAASTANPGEPEVYTVTVNGQSYVVQVNEGGDVTHLAPVGGAAAPVAAAPTAPVSGGEPIPAPLAGNILKVLVTPGQAVQEGDVLVILEAMKMETEIRSPSAGTVTTVSATVGKTVAVGDTLLSLA